MGKKLKNRICLSVIGCLILYFLINYLSSPKLHGRWYLYKGEDITTEKNITEKLNSRDYIDISTTLVNTYASNGKDGVASYKIRGNKMYCGDSILSFKVTNVEEKRVLYLTEIGYNMGYGEDNYIENGTTYTYVFGKDINSFDF